MTQNIVLRERDIISKVAARLAGQGYAIKPSPNTADLPEFLRGYSPDLLAIGSKDSVIVEVQSKGKVRRTDYWKSLYRTVRQHPEWHLQVVVNPEPEQESISEVEIGERLVEGAQLADQKRFNAALLVTWSAVEAAMRFALEKVDAQELRPTPNLLLHRLVAEGLLDGEEYEFLSDCLERRNAVVHGYRAAVDSEIIHLLQKIALMLLQPLDDSESHSRT